MLELQAKSTQCLITGSGQESLLPLKKETKSVRVRNKVTKDSDQDKEQAIADSK